MIPTIDIKNPKSFPVFFWNFFLVGFFILVWLNGVEFNIFQNYSTESIIFLSLAISSLVYLVLTAFLTIFNIIIMERTKTKINDPSGYFFLQYTTFTLGVIGIIYYLHYRWVVLLVVSLYFFISAIVSKPLWELIKEEIFLKKENN